MNLQVGQRIADRYEVVELIGESDEAELYAVKSLAGNELLDLKRIRAATARNAKQLENFRRQSRVVRDLDHPNLIRVIDVGDDDGLPYLVMERLRSPTLRDKVQQDGPFPVSRFIPVARQMLAALSFLHARGVIHRDVNPNAFLLDDNDQLKLRDFGMAREVEGNKTMALPSGAPAHMAPEQLMGQPLDLRADVYSAGTVFFELLTGKVPLEGLDLISRFTKAPPRVAGHIPETPLALDDLVAACLSPEPSHRPGSADAVLAALDGIAQPPAMVLPEPEAAVVAEPEPTPVPSPPETPHTKTPAHPEVRAQPEPEIAVELPVVSIVPTAPAPPAQPASPWSTPPPKPASAAKPGVLLRSRMGNKPERPAPVVDALIRIAQRLEALAQENAYHAPLSPETIRLDRDGEILIDPAQRPTPGQTVIVHNPAYLSPECLFGPPVETGAVALADIYSLGFIAFEWLLGSDAYHARFPFDAAAEGKIQWMQWHGDPSQTVPRPADAASWIPTPLSDLLQAMTAKSTSDRLTSYTELIERLEGIRKRIDETRHVEAPRSFAFEGASTETSTPQIRLILLATGAVLLIIFVILILWFLLGG